VTAAAPRALLSAALALFPALLARAQTGAAPPTREQVAPGITYSEHRWRAAGDGPWAMQVLEVDPADPGVNLLPVRALDRPAARETVSSMAKRYGATAAINGGYFVVKGDNEGASTGVYQLNRRVIGSGSGRSALLFCAEKNFREQLAVAVVTLPGRVRAGSCHPVDIVGAGPRVVRGGKIEVAGEMFAHAAVRHPRTAVAITGRGTFLFVTLDGRQTHSAGMTLEELARELIGMGAVEAINLDGGGSTTMVVKDVVRNSPSDGRERPVSDAILIYGIRTRDELEALRAKLRSADRKQAARVLREARWGVTRRGSNPRAGPAPP